MKIVICGSTGKMGTLVKKIAEEKNHEIVGEISGATRDFTDILKSSKPDICIDFSAPAATIKLCESAEVEHIPLIIGTTGLSESDRNVIEKHSSHIPILLSSNFSIGIFLLKKLVKEAADILPKSFDIEIVEKHHTAKKDAPSGTALSIFDEIKKSRTDAMAVFGRHGSSLHEAGEVGIHAIRGGNIVGEHEVHFIGQDEEIKISHVAYDRKIFAAGAILAAERLLKIKTPGLYSMSDIF